MSDPFICSVGKRRRPVRGCAVTGSESVQDAARDVILASVAMVARDIGDVDVPASVLIEGVDASLVAQTLAAIVAAVFGATLPDGGRQLLIRLSTEAVASAGDEE